MVATITQLSAPQVTTNVWVWVTLVYQDLTESVDSVVRVYQKTLKHSYDFLHMTGTTAQLRRLIYLRKCLTSIAIIGYNTNSMNVKKSTTLHS